MDGQLSKTSENEKIQITTHLEESSQKSILPTSEEDIQHAIKTYKRQSQFFFIVGVFLGLFFFNGGIYSYTKELKMISYLLSLTIFLIFSWIAIYFNKVGNKIKK